MSIAASGVLLAVGYVDQFLGSGSVSLIFPLGGYQRNGTNAFVFCR